MIELKVNGDISEKEVFHIYFFVYEWVSIPLYQKGSDFGYLKNPKTPNSTSHLY